MMRRWTNFLIGLSVVVAGMTTASLLPSAPVSAATCPGGTARLLTFPAWYNGLVNDNCEVTKVGNGGMSIRDFVVRIALNIVEMLLQLVGYACVVFIIIGGFKYMVNDGDPSGLARARKTIMNAIIGLVISIASVVIVNSIAGVV